MNRNKLLFIQIQTLLPSPIELEDDSFVGDIKGNFKHMMKFSMWSVLST
jgi:hypothetical protein